MRNFSNALLGPQAALSKEGTCSFLARCSVCSCVEQIKYRTAEDQPVCASCYRKEFDAVECADCGEMKRAVVLSEEGPTCHSCYYIQNPSPRTCEECGTGAAISGTDMCALCAVREQRRRQGRWVPQRVRMAA